MSWTGKLTSAGSAATFVALDEFTGTMSDVTTDAAKLVAVEYDTEMEEL